MGTIGLELSRVGIQAEGFLSCLSPRTDGSETRAEQRMDVDSRGIARWWVSKAVNVLNMVRVGVGECQSMYMY